MISNINFKTFDSYSGLKILLQKSFEKKMSDVFGYWFNSWSNLAGF